MLLLLQGDLAGFPGRGEGPRGGVGEPVFLGGWKGQEMWEAVGLTPQPAHDRFPHPPDKGK